ncbi:MAG: integrase/recombinase XerD [Flavobacteriales bacterium]|jgi:integrase/recombinase XerD
MKVFTANRSVSLSLFYRGILAEHLLESGTDLRYIQVLLGHNSTRTTEVYTQVAINNIKAIKSPFDTLHLK